MIDCNDIAISEYLGNVNKDLSELESLGIEQFKKRIDGLKEIIEEFPKHVIRSGLVGITSSGKSSLLNVILGLEEKMLKEQSKATTNMIVFCSKTAEPQIEVHFEDDKIVKKRGKDVKPEFLWKYTSEDENPQNKYNVKYIRLGLPTFLLGDGLEIADTPGLDAYGNKEHEDLTLREFLPQADLIIYLSSIGSPMKGTDRRTLNQIMDADQRVVFVQTCKGSVVEQSTGDGTTVSVTEQLDSYKETFAKAIEHYQKLKDAPIVQVETTIAKDYLKNKDRTAWQESGLEEFEHAINHVTGQLRANTTLKKLRTAVTATKALSDLIKSADKDKRDKERDLEEKKEYLKKSKADLEKIIKDKDDAISKALETIDPSSLIDKYSAELKEVYTERYDFNPMHDKEFIAKAHALGERTKALKNDFLECLDNARDRYRSLFNELGLEIKRADMQNVIQKEFSLPNAQKKRVAEALSRDSKQKEKPKIKDEYKEIDDEYIDKGQYIQDMANSLKLYFEPLKSHISWWEKAVDATYIQPLEKKIDGLEDDLKKIEKGILFDESQLKKLAVISGSLDNHVKAISDIYCADLLEYKGPIYEAYTKKLAPAWVKADNTTLLLQLNNHLVQSLFNLSYNKCINAISAKPDKNIILAGNSYGNQIRFVRHLMRLDTETTSGFMDRKPPFSINVQNRNTGIHNIEVSAEYSPGISFYILGNDIKSLERAETNNLFEKTDVIQYMIDDMHRVASALSDMVERNLFFKLMNRHKDKLLLTYPAAAHFQKDRLHIMFNEALVEINKVFSHSGKAHWFIYENFEIRYNYFNEFAEKMMSENINTDKCIREWKSQKIPLGEPFTEKVLREQFELLLIEK